MCRDEQCTFHATTLSGILYIVGEEVFGRSVLATKVVKSSLYII